MKRLFIPAVAAAMAVAASSSAAPGRQNSLEGAWYGTNYTVPFAHAYRELGRRGVDRKEAIDRDVYHMSRLGLNAFRLHLWDVELADSAGNLLSNDHLDLLDYLIDRLERRGIDVLLTAQTNFGNGYPERDIDTRSYTYRSSKCTVHSDPVAVAAQERYLSQLAAHVNPYTGRSYRDDPSIVGMEINNEPCHEGQSSPQVRDYINRMIRVLRKSGWKKPVLYNVSHNPDVRDAYFKAPVDGATYQWYPLGLVAGQMRRGNFLPCVDSYDIPFDTLKGFDRPAKVIYEFDPADNLSGYLFPAMARTFRKTGFRWITQFAYDPIDMADANTEYQTHYLNLAYTPAKALAMMIAAEVVRNTPENTDYGKYPVDTVFGPFKVDAIRNMAIMNTPSAYIYSGSTADAPVNAASLERVAGLGSSPVISYGGTGAYFADRLDSTTWRLEIMPDVDIIADPFAKTSPSRKVAMINYDAHPLKAGLPGLPGDFHVSKIAGPDGPVNQPSARASLSSFLATPGVYLLSASADASSRYSSDTPYGDNHRLIGEYVAPAVPEVPALTVHTPQALAWAGDTIPVEALITEGPGLLPVDSVAVYPASVSFWSRNNPVYPMTRIEGTRRWRTLIPVGDRPQSSSAYYIVVWRGGDAVTWPGNTPGTPLDWDYAPDSDAVYSTTVARPGVATALLLPAPGMDGSLISTIPGVWNAISYTYRPPMPGRGPSCRLDVGADAGASSVTIGKYTGHITSSLGRLNPGRTALILSLSGVEGIDSVNVSVVNRDGFTYGATLPADNLIRIPLTALSLQPTMLNPEPYPTFLGRSFIPDPATAVPLRGAADIDEVRVTVTPVSGRAAQLDLGGIWIDEL